MEELIFIFLNYSEEILFKVLKIYEELIIP